MTPEQLAAIRARANVAATGVWIPHLVALAERDVPALLTEVERLTAELECKTGTLQRIHNRAASGWNDAPATIARTAQAALDLEVFDGSVPPGGWVCAICHTPVESEPCALHNPTIRFETRRT
jgi:hypothetical protein